MTPILLRQILAELEELREMHLDERFRILDATGDRDQAVAAVSRARYTLTLIRQCRRVLAALEGFDYAEAMGRCHSGDDLCC